ncbi:MAG: MFS transporter [Eubacteriales bacterium]|nr:MFS transporter [Eubacteriales bacterium]
MTKQQKSTVAFLSFCFIAYMTTGINSIVQTLINSFPDVSASTVRMTATLPSLSTLITSLLAGMTVGKKIKFRTSYITACILFTIGGFMPIFLNSSFGWILLSRFIFGCGTGLCLTYNAYALRYYPRELSSGMMGWALFMCNFGSVVSQLAAGWLAEIDWRYAFLIYSICPVVLFVIIFMLQEPEPAKQNDAGAIVSDAGKRAYSSLIPVYIVFIVLAGLWIGPINSGLSTFIFEHDLGGSLVSGIMLSVYTMAGALSGTVLDHLKKLGRFSVSVVLACVGAGFIIVVLSGSLLQVAVGVALCGFGYMIYKPLFTINLSREVKSSSMTLVSTLLLSSANLGIFLSNAWIKLSSSFMAKLPGGEIDKSFYGAALMFTLSAVFFLVYHLVRLERPGKESGKALRAHTGSAQE